MTRRAATTRAAGPRPDLATETSPGVGEGEVLLLVPVGSVEQHGPHLPLATDTVVAATVTWAAAAALVAEGRRVLVAPAVAYGNSGEHEGFPGTVSIGHEALHAVLVELGRSACRWAQGVIFVNGHGGNVATLRGAVSLLRYEGRPVAWTVCDVPGGDAHAGRTETSLALELMGGAVRSPLAEAGCTLPLAQLLPRLRRDGVRAVSANGVLGDPAGASAAEGRLLHTRLVATLMAELQALDVGDDGRLVRPDAPGRDAAPGRAAAPAAARVDAGVHA